MFSQRSVFKVRIMYIVQSWSTMVVLLLELDVESVVLNVDWN